MPFYWKSSYTLSIPYRYPIRHMLSYAVSIMGIEKPYKPDFCIHESISDEFMSIEMHYNEIFVSKNHQKHFEKDTFSMTQGREA